MENTLIIKTGAVGDVVRTTSLLNVIAGNIYWITDNASKPLFPGDIQGLNVWSLAEAFYILKNIRFSRIISLEEDGDCAELAVSMKASHLTGIYANNGKINYTDDSSPWFDMSKVSKLGIKKANELKKRNELSYQHYIFQMAGEKFNGEPYRIFAKDGVNSRPGLIGIERRTGTQWPNKQWSGYDELIERLSENGFRIRTFEQRENIRDYLVDIAECYHIVSGDTLAMHIALGYKKTCTAIFNCTSLQEIYDYGMVKKVVSPLLDKYFYSSSYDAEVIQSISVDEVIGNIALAVE